MGRFDHIPTQGETAPAAAPERDFSATAYTEQALQAHVCGDLQSALRLYGRALEEDRDHVPAWLGQVRVLLDMHQPEEAATWLEQAANVVGEVPGVLALRALAAVGRGAFDDARAWSDRAMKAGPDVAEVWLSRAAVVYASGNSAMARVNLDKAHEREPGAVTARRCAEVALDMGDLIGAERWLRKAAAGAPDSALVALRQGVYFERCGDLDQARHHLARALQLEPRLQPARVALDDLDHRGPLDRLKSTFRKWSRP
ncbi:MAG: tetratricopeptide repeat protein [Alphaproteobacteria bacterium]|nr:tetratricopeptide repeat protein [Alphaproteobacteria bacterium]